MKRSILSVALVLVLSGSAFTQESLSLQTTKSSGAAKRMSLFGTLGPVAAGIGVSGATGGEAGNVGVGLSFAGLVIGPGLGHLYARNPGRALLGVGLRIVALTTCGYMADRAAREDRPWHETLGPTVAWFGLGIAIAVGSAVYDIRTTCNSVDRYNRQHSLSAVSVAPTYFAAQHAPGISLTWRF